MKEADDQPNQDHENGQSPQITAERIKSLSDAWPAPRSAALRALNEMMDLQGDWLDKVRRNLVALGELREERGVSTINLEGLLLVAQVAQELKEGGKLFYRTTPNQYREIMRGAIETIRERQ